MRKIYVFVVAIVLFGMSCNTEGDSTEEPNAPTVEQKVKELTTHGHTRIDNYYWLNDRENPDVIDYLNRENAYTDTMMQHTEAFQEKLFNEIVGRIKQTDESIPYKENGYFYYNRYEEGNEHAIYCRKKETMEADEEILLNANELAEGKSYFQLGGMSISPNNKLLAYSVDTVSRRKYTIYFKNLETNEIYEETIPLTNGGITWANNNKTIFYATKDEQTLRSNKIHKHLLGTNSSKDNIVFEEKDETFSCYVYKSKTNDFILIGSSSTLTTEYQILNASKPDAKFTIFQARERGLEYSITHFDNKFYVVTNMDGAKNFKLMETPDNKTSKDNWTEIIAHRNDVLLEGIEVFKNYLVIDERAKGLTQIRIINQTDKSEHYLNFGEETYSAWVTYNPELDTETLRYAYSSMTTPSSTFDYSMVSKEKELLKQQEVVGDFDPINYESKRLYATASDGTQVPISLVYKKGIKLDGSNPLLLYAYGSYGYSIDAAFHSTRLSLLDRGFVYAIAHIRGGQELGRDWYENGKLLKKMNTFTDFNACAEHLISEKYTNKDKLFAMGGSAGGLLMGVIVNLKPEIYKGVIAAVPFVDVITTMLDESIPLTTSEFDEWGNPKDSVYYHYMLSYSPYDNVEKKNYPAMLVTTGLHDSQVQYWEPAKWVAKLRVMKTDKNPLLFKINMEAGHGGASGRFKRYRETALEYAFMFDLLGITE